MSVLVIRANKRFAVRRPVTLREDGGSKRNGLMIELSSEGCRISNVDSRAYTLDQAVTLELGGGERLGGRVRWAHDGFLGLKFVAALRQSELGQLIEASRLAIAC